MTALKSTLDPRSPAYAEAAEAMAAKLAELETEHAKAIAGGGETYVDRHHARGKLTARERIELLVDPDSPFLELSPLAAWGSDFAVGASVVTGIGAVEGVECLIVANDPTVKGGTTNPWTLKKMLRANQIALQLAVPRGGELLAGADAHVVSYELGAAAAISGISTRTWPSVGADLDAAQIANARMNGMHDVWQHPQLRERRRWVDVDTPAGRLPALLPPGQPNGYAPRMDAVAALGEHTEALLRELDYDPGAIARLRAEHAI